MLNNRALFEYSDGFQEWIEFFKFKGDYQRRFAFSTELKEALSAYPHYTICPLPLSEERFGDRGFNQVSACLDAAGVTYFPLLKRKRHDTPQAGKKREERLQLQQPFEMAPDGKKMRASKVLLVDDVYTTGRTLFHAADCLLENGFTTVKSLTFAR
ncbi:hypothetical protein NRIC_13060 [Enterococcus florum]|uniref:Phosphoribosyltransferase domain-containing protein n=1 Tax=Enterococcus florum TaxID=2480627 RepID=A0A4P5P691_9ENTE|nr:hypothetical protein NRIC_13060 [Enterococcus florum]